MKRILFFLWAAFVCLLACPERAFSQAAGLRFFGQGEVLDKRTSLDLGGGNAICLDSDFEISFDISFLPNQKDYFGYILRIINERGQNVDLIYDQKKTNARNFKVIIGKEYSDIGFRLDDDALFNRWNSFSLKFIHSSRKLVFTYNGKQLIHRKVLGEDPGCLRFLFGANDYKQFKTTDVPAMNIRNIRIIEEGKEIHRWPLNEMEGSTSRDEISGAFASVRNPGWIRSLHTKWQFAGKTTVAGYASTAFDASGAVLYVVGSDSLSKYHINQGAFESIKYSRKHPLPVGNQSLFDISSRKLINIYPDQKKVLYFDGRSGSWNSEFAFPTPLTEFWHANKFISSFDSSIYVIGGYGQLKYKSGVERYDRIKKSWETIHTTGDSLAPRYLAGLGTNAGGSSAYIIGGYGSQTGEQMLSPENYYDLFRYDVKTRRLVRLYELKDINEDFAFANSLVIDEAANSFYGLIFQNNKYNAQLQLLRGSLDKPEYELLADTIPYKFHDIESFADLYYAPDSRKLVAVTLAFSKTNTTEVTIYTIDFPPGKLVRVAPTEGSKAAFFMGVIILAALVFGLLMYIRRRRFVRPAPDPVLAYTEPGVVPANELPAGVEVESFPEVPAAAAAPSYKSSILLFGNLQAYDKEGQDITRMFTPLLKELLLIIIIYTIRWERGVSSEKLNEVLWFDKSEKDARNNRSVNMAKLRAILDRVGCCQISKDTGYWKLIPLDSQLYIDFQEYITIARRRDDLSKEMVSLLLRILERGTFLSTTDYEWLDDLKSEISNEVISLLLKYVEKNGIDQDTEFVIRLMNHVFSFDLVNEEAVAIKCRALVHLGKHSLAYQAFEKFKKDYRALYGEDYDENFQNVVKAN